MIVQIMIQFNLVIITNFAISQDKIEDAYKIQNYSTHSSKLQD